MGIRVTEPPRDEVLLIPSGTRLVDVGRAAPVGTADLRAIPDVDRIAAPQKDALKTLATVPAIEPRCGRCAVPHHEVDPARIHRNLIVDVPVITVQRLCVGIAEDFSAHCEGALLLNGDRGAGCRPLAL